MKEAHQSNSSALYQDFVVQLDANLLLQLMASYNLKASDVTGDYSFSSFAFEKFIENEPYNVEGSSLKNTATFVRNWPQKLTWSQLNHQLNHFLLAWLSDYKSGASLDVAILLARCLVLNTSKNAQFQSLLIHLISRVTNQLDQYKYSYVQHFDVETRLPNEHLLINLIQNSLNEANENNQTHFGLIVINLNINYGQASQLNSASNELMMAAIHTIQQHLNDEATLFYVGTIELAILIKPLKSQTQLNLIATRLSHAFETALPLQNVTLILSPYFGAISTFNIQTSAISFYEYARLALHQGMVKNESIKLYDQDISSSFMNSRLLDEAIIEALQQNELEIYLQPIITINEGSNKANSFEKSSTEICKSAEALLRWPNQKWKSISPARLLDVIYKKGFAKVFIRWLINNACQRSAELATLQRQISITINLTSTDLLDADLPDLLAQSIALWGISANSLTIEITESDILVDEVRVLQVLDKIIQLGFRLALDDFGTGYSSMARLRNLPIDIVKIDQSFVRNISTSSQDKEIVLSIMKLAHSLGKEVVAEGVEKLACLNILREMQCEKIQGYYFAKPMAFEAFIHWLETFNGSHKTSEFI